MARERKTEPKRSKSPSTSFLKSAPAQEMVPRLMVILSTLFLVVVGLVMVYSSSSITSLVEQGDPLGEAIKQCVFAVIGTAMAVAVAKFVGEDAWRGRIGDLFYWVCMGFLVLTFIFGTVGLGAKRWLVIGPISIQISEFAKIAFVMMAARFVEEYREGRLDFMVAARKGIFFIAVPLVAFVFGAQSDLGTTIICLVGVCVVVWLGGLSWRATVFVLLIAAVIGVIAVVAFPYRMQRLINFSDPWADAQNTGYQLVHSFKALASGGLLGVGVGNSYEKLLYLPEAETDFIFAIVGEELGLMGSLFVIVAFMVFLVGGFKIAKQARSPFMALFAAGLTVMIVFQAFLNISCVVGLAPTTGKPLPFISSGGSSLLSSLLLVGVLLSISYSSSNEGEYRQRRDNLRVVSAERREEYREERPSEHRDRHRDGHRDEHRGGRRPNPSNGYSGRGSGLRISQRLDSGAISVLPLVQAGRPATQATYARQARAQRR